MLRGFDLKLNKKEFSTWVTQQKSVSWDMFLDFGKGTQDSRLREVKETLTKDRLVLSGSDLESNWFPKIQNHIFLSHSHADEELALGIAGALKHWLGLDVFVDSAVWKYYQDLQKFLFRRAKSLQEPSETKDNLLELWNSAASHAHRMLTKSLIQMIDQSECLLYLNTPASIPISNVSTGSAQTYSPWIYVEVEASRMLRCHVDPRRSKLSKIAESVETYDEAIKELAVAYPINLSHMGKLDCKSLVSWICEGYKTNNSSADRKQAPFAVLDVLYNSL